MTVFELKTTMQPKGSQPDAIDQLITGLKKGFSYQTLLGVTGSGKTFTMGQVIQKVR